MAFINNNMFLIFCFILTAWLQNVGAACPPIISKKEWDAVPTKHVQYLPVPVDLVIIQHTVTQTCSNDNSCAELVRDIQNTHLNKAFIWDIGPSFLVANTGKVYEGRGWNHVAVHTFGYNNQSIGIAFIGNFNNQEPTPKALNAARELIQCGVEEERLTADHQVVIHSQLLPTESPGKMLASKIKLWPDWKQDVSEIKKRADTQDIQIAPDTKSAEVDSVASRDAGDVASTKPRTKREILATPRQIDLLSSSRDVISELIDNLRNLAQQTLKTVESLTRGLGKQASSFIDQITASMRRFKEQISTAIGAISLIPGAEHCSKPIHEKSNKLYDNTETKAKACADKRVKEIDDMIKNLGTLSSDTINYTNTAVEQTRNCTELNFGLEPTTKACLNSVTAQTQSATKTYESQKTLALNSIKTALDALPAALDLCGKKPLLDASTETTKILSEITQCKPSLPFIRW